MRQRHQDRTCRELTSSISPNVSRQRARNLAFKLNSPPSQDCVNNSGSRHHRFADIALPHRATRHLKHAVKASRRSEEHTSELQSLMRISYAVFCLKKKNNFYYFYIIVLLNSL